MKTSEFLDMVCDALDRPAGSLKPEDTRDSVAEWDSLGHLSILAEIEDVVGSGVEEKELQEFDSIGELIDRLKARGALED